MRQLYRKWRRRLWEYLNRTYYQPPGREPEEPPCAHVGMRVLNGRITQEDGMSYYVLMLVECSTCHEQWRLQHRVDEISQISGGTDRFHTTRELGLEAVEECGRLVKTDVVDETLRILRENRAPGQRRYDPYQPKQKPRKRRRSKRRDYGR